MEAAMTASAAGIADPPSTPSVVVEPAAVLRTDTRRGADDFPESAFAAHRTELLRFARRSLGDGELAEDAVQETFLRAWRARDRYDPSIAGVRTWLFAIVRRVIIDLSWARTRHAAQSSDAMVADLAGGDDDIGRAMTSMEVQAAVRRLAPEHRRVLVEVYYRQRSGREVARELGIPEGTVRSRLHYSLRQLRLILEEAGWEGTGLSV
jgi:RNA polymerase sigma-70 factor (ECF subfamily)